MIWAVDSKKEIENYPISPIFKYYREVLGKENVALLPIDENNPFLDFLNPKDIILLRTANEKVIDFAKNNCIRTTAEDFEKYEMVKDKLTLNRFFNRVGILTPSQYSIQDLCEGSRYFVKPRFGAESIGISQNSICDSISDVIKQVHYIQEKIGQEAIIEDYIDGIDCTVACYTIAGDPSKIYTFPMFVETSSKGNIQTHEGKCSFDEYCSAILGKEAEEISSITQDVFLKLGLKHHARIDFRKGLDGKFYLIDVNLLPGLGPTAHFAKCMLLCENKSYKDAIEAIIKSAS